MDRKFSKWSLYNPTTPEDTKHNRVYFKHGKGFCELDTTGLDVQPYRRLIASAPDLHELLIAALPALEVMQWRTPEHLENLAGVAIVAPRERGACVY